MRILGKYRGAVRPAAGESLKLNTAHGAGVFSGWAGCQLLATKPTLLPALCEFGDGQDQIMCINGAIETLTVHKMETAVAAYRTLPGETAMVCWAATPSKIRGLDKAFHPYYPESPTPARDARRPPDGRAIQRVL